jgi:hypothetical protein
MSVVMAVIMAVVMAVVMTVVIAVVMTVVMAVVMAVAQGGFHIGGGRLLILADPVFLFVVKMIGINNIIYIATINIIVNITLLVLLCYY